MKNLFALLFIAGVFASCGTPSTDSVSSSDTTAVAMDTCAVVDSAMMTDTMTTATDSVK
jgi:hypothetical protein